MKKTYYLQDKLIENIDITIKNKILNLSKEGIDQIFNEIDEQVNDLSLSDQLYILEELRTKFEDKATYYHAKQNKKYDFDAFRYGLKTFIIAIIVICLLYIVIIYYDRPESQKLDAVIQELTKYGITITKCSKNYGKMTSEYLQVVANEDISSDQLLIANHLVKRAFEIHKNLYGKWSTIVEKIEDKISLLKIQISQQGS